MVCMDVALGTRHVTSCDWLMKVIRCKFGFRCLIHISDYASILRRMWETTPLDPLESFYLEESTVGSPSIQKPSNNFPLIPLRWHFHHVAREIERVKRSSWRLLLDWQIRRWFSNLAMSATSSAFSRGVHCQSAKGVSIGQVWLRRLSTGSYLCSESDGRSDFARASAAWNGGFFPLWVSNRCSPLMKRSLYTPGQYTAIFLVLVGQVPIISHQREQANTLRPAKANWGHPSRMKQVPPADRAVRRSSLHYEISDEIVLNLLLPNTRD